MLLVSQRTVEPNTQIFETLYLDHQVQQTKKKQSILKANIDAAQLSEIKKVNEKSESLSIKRAEKELCAVLELFTNETDKTVSVCKILCIFSKIKPLQLYSFFSVELLSRIFYHLGTFNYPLEKRSQIIGKFYKDRLQQEQDFESQVWYTFSLTKAIGIHSSIILELLKIFYLRSSKDITIKAKIQKMNFLIDYYIRAQGQQREKDLKAKHYDDDYIAYKPTARTAKQLINKFIELNGFRLGHYFIRDLYSERQLNHELTLAQERKRVAPFQPKMHRCQRKIKNSFGDKVSIQDSLQKWSSINTERRGSEESLTQEKGKRVRFAETGRNFGGDNPIFGLHKKSLSMEDMHMNCYQIESDEEMRSEVQQPNKDASDPVLLHTLALTSRKTKQYYEEFRSPHFRKESQNGSQKRKNPFTIDHSSITDEDEEMTPLKVNTNLAQQSTLSRIENTFQQRIAPRKTSFNILDSRIEEESKESSILDEFNKRTSITTQLIKRKNINKFSIEDENDTLVQNPVLFYFDLKLTKTVQVIFSFFILQNRTKSIVVHLYDTPESISAHNIFCFLKIFT